MPRVVAPSLTVTVPVGVPPPPVTVTFIELADPKVEGSGAWTAATVDGASTVLQVVTLTLSTHQPTTPPQPSRPTAKRTLIVSPVATARAGVGQVDDRGAPVGLFTLPPSVPVKPG